MESILKAAVYAAQWHVSQRRKDPSQTPFINHPLGVAHLCAAIGGVDDPIVLQAALLHDVIEDTPCTVDDVRAAFDAEVATVVAGCSDDKSLPKAERKLLQIKHAPHLSQRARLVKLADFLYNIRDIAANPPVGWDMPRLIGYMEWARRVVEGLRGTNEALETAIDEALAPLLHDVDGDVVWMRYLKTMQDIDGK